MQQELHTSYALHTLHTSSRMTCRNRNEQAHEVRIARRPAQSPVPYTKQRPVPSTLQAWVRCDSEHKLHDCPIYADSRILPARRYAMYTCASASLRYTACGRGTDEGRQCVTSQHSVELRCAGIRREGGSQWLARGATALPVLEMRCGMQALKACSMRQCW